MKKLLLIACISVLSSAIVFGQSNSGRIVGTVTDASGVVPGAIATITDDKTSRERTVVTSSCTSHDLI